ncbi:MAG TPA: LuxR C-terminal-related transcriptional regulator, partial [Anaerolineales bacterium]|nr:LuxR C-terminal-related transcriptional regulator [Anaerolineales bacterium]
SMHKSVHQLDKRTDETLPIIKTLDPEVAEAVNKVIQKATRKKPERRFQDALEMAAAFREETKLRQNKRGAKLVESLSLREHEILNLIIKGNTNKQIAEILFLELSTIKWYINKIYKKLSVRSRVQAIIRARELDLIVFTGVAELKNVESSHSPIEYKTRVNPYKGLRAFEAADHRDYFGREAFVDHLLNDFINPVSDSRNEFLGNNRFLAVVGPSGSGKSSLVKAGLIPALWSGNLPGSENWFIVTMMPGTRPLDALETSLMGIASDQSINIHEHLNRDRQGLARVADLILPDDDSELMVVIDQFEELFTLVDSESIRSHYLDLIQGAVDYPNSRVRVVITLRADYFDRPLNYPDFGSLVRAHQETLLPLSVEELEKAIINPAQQAGVTFESGLVAKIIEDVNHQPGALPLLQFALTELFEQRKGTILTSHAYQVMGRTTGSLAKRAEDLFLEQDASGKEMIRQMFLRLIDVGDRKRNEASKVPTLAETRRRVKRTELLSAASEPDRLDDIIDMYADYRLITLDHDLATRQPTVELAHEALLQAWNRLRGWLEESIADLNLHRQLIHVTHEWIESGRDESFLLRGARLSHFESWTAGTQLGLTQNEKTFLDTSISSREERAAIERNRQQEKAQLEQYANRRLRQLVLGLVMGLVIAIGLTIAAVSYAHRAEEQQQIAEQQKRLYLARELMAAATTNLETDPELSILLALESIDTTYPIDGTILPELEDLLHLAVQADRTEIMIPMVGYVAFSPDGGSLVIGSSTGELKLWDSITGEELFQLDGHTSLISGLTFSPEGRFLASSSFDGQVKIWDLTSEKLVTLITGHEGQVNDVVFRPDGRQLITVAPDAVRIWDTTVLYNLSSGESIPYEISEPTFIRPLHDGANTIAYSPDGQRIAVIRFGFGIRVWESDLEKQVLEISDVSEYASSIVFSPDGEYLAGVSSDLGVTLWNADSGEEELYLPEDASVTHIAFSQDGRLLVTAAKNGMITLWDLETYTQMIRILGQPTGFNFMALSPDGYRVAAGNGPDRTNIWDVSPTGGGEWLTISAHEGKVFDAIYNPAGTKIASTGEEGTVRVWDASTGELLHDLPAQRDWFHFPAFSPDGERMAAANNEGGITIWDTHTGEELLTMYGDAPNFTAIAFSPNGSKLASGGKGGIAHIWDVITGQRLTTIKNPNGISITELVYSLDGDHIFSYDLLGIARAWNSETGEQLMSLSAGLSCEATVWDAALSSDGWLQAMASF